MAIKSADQISIIDVTDAYSVMLTSESYTFKGDYAFATQGQECSTTVVAYRGAEQMECKIGTVTTPNGITASVTSNNTKNPTVNMTVNASNTISSSGIIQIPVTIYDGASSTGVTITKEFAYSVALSGLGVHSSETKYAVSDDGINPPDPSGDDWGDDIPSAVGGQYIWTRTEIILDGDNHTGTYSYSVTKQGAVVSSTEVEYTKSNSGTVTPTSGWSLNPPSASPGSYIWTRTTIQYDDGTTAISYSVGMIGETGDKGDKGDKGDNGADAITMTITSSAGTIFKNSSIATTLTAHVYQAGVELNDTQIAALGTIKWYKDGSSTAAGTGKTLTITAGSVANNATYIAQLEG